MNIWFPKVIIILIMTAQVLFLNVFSKKDPHLNAVEISPSKGIIFINQPYHDSTSDKEIVGRSVIFDPRFWEEGDLYMTDLRVYYCRWFYSSKCRIK